MPRLGWYVLIHALPPKPLYLRAKVRQRLAQAGAIALKNSVYVVPKTPEHLEDLQWIAEEARAGGGDAFIMESAFLEGIDDAALIARFRDERAADYRSLIKEIRTLDTGRPSSSLAERIAVSARLSQKLAAIAAIDVFVADEKKEAEAMLEAVEKKLKKSAARPKQKARAGRPAAFKKRTWVTRTGVKVDRIASSWLIRRFIDHAARFKFIDAAGEEAKAGELRFDMTGGDFTHEGEQCTFETLRARFSLEADPALAAIAEIVHDIDLKDARFGRPEAAGVKQLIDGLIAANAGDEARLERGFVLFDDLYASFAKAKKAKR